ncbi:tyrosine-type recombinase/integrase [Leptotrichia trevisanii]|jgi:probable tyrosine recombinase xerC-like|uniref:tyrosine-type recombinase/integrase n=1 Tax=Leptotrichia trevisanii TaxID=109328 RepID=UPI00041B1A6A|nr:site-specific integrase [Leptotrichia trevisanii]DAQ00645.1 MAG TPA: SITE SPECIFIC RECOMBINASE XERD [Caudoviricetes sp.]
MEIVNNYNITNNYQSGVTIINKKNYYVEHEIKYLTIQEYFELEKMIHNDFHKMLVRFLFETAARISEALSFDIRDIDLKYNKVKLVNSKQRKAAKRECIISNELMNMMLVHINKYKLDKKDKLFTRVTAKGKKIYQRYGAYDMIKKYGLNILGYDWVKPHTFRHTRAVHLLSENVDIIKVQKFLGHKSLKNTLIYLQYVNRDIDKSILEANSSIGIH